MTSQRADELLGLGRWAEARAAYEEHLVQHPDDIDSRTGHGVAVLGSGDAAAAVQELSWVLERAPGRADARYNRAMAHASLGQDAQAIADLDLLIVDQPQAWYLRSDRGGLLLRGGQVGEALTELRRAVELAPQESGPQLNLGSALLAAGEPAEAHSYLSRAFEARVPGAYTALRRARQEHYERTDWEEVREAAASVLAAGSAAEVAELASAAPYLLSESLLDYLEQAVRSSPDLASAGERLRLTELRRLAAGEESSSRGGTSEQDSYRRLADQQVLLYQRGDREEAIRMAPALVEMARSVFGPDSAEYGLQLAGQATFERSDALFSEALEVLVRVAPSLVPGAAANHASTQSDQEAAALLASVLPYVDVDVPQDTAARVYEGLGDRLRRLGRMQEAERVVRGALDSRRFTGEARARLLVALAQTVFYQEGYDEAPELVEQALDQYREALGDTHEKVAETQRGLGRIHAEAGHTELGERWLTRAADTWRRLGDPMQLALTHGDLAAVYARAGARDAARRVAAEALGALDAQRESPHEATALFAIRDAFHQLGDLTQELGVQLRLVELVPEPVELNNLADIYYRSSRYEDAARWYAEALSQAPPGDSFVIHHNLANALYEVGRTDEGIAHHEQALAGMRAALPAGDPTLLHALVDLAGTLARLGQLDRAATLIAEAQPHLGGVPVLRAKAAALAQQLNLDPTGLGSAEEQYRLLVQQARQARARGAYQEAERILDQAIEVVTQAYGSRHPEIADLKLFLAAVRRGGGRVRGAEELIREALSIQLESLAPDDRRLVVSRAELGTLLAEARRDGEAAELLASAAEQSEGEQLGRVLSALGLIAQRRGDLAAAERHLRRALDLAEGQDNQLTGQKNLVMLLIEERRLGEARELAEQTVANAVEWFGISDPRTGLALLIYAKALREQGRYGACEQMAAKALTLLSQAHPDDHPDVADAVNELGLALAGQGRLAEAEPWFQRAVVSVRGDLGREPTVLANQAAVYADLGDLGRATSLLAHAAGLLEAALGTDAPEYGRVLARLGRLELSQGKGTAADTLTRAYRIIEASAGGRARLAEPLSDLATLYMQIGARDTAMSFAERALAIMYEAYGPDHPALAPYLATLAQGKAFADELDVAEALFAEALARHPEATETLRAFAYFQAARGEREAALRTLEGLVRREDELLAGLTAAAASQRRRHAFSERLWTTVNAYLTLATPDDAHRAWALVVSRFGLDAEYLRAERGAALRGSGGYLITELGNVRAQAARAVIAGDTARAQSLRQRGDELEGLLAGYVTAGIETPDVGAVAAALPAGTTLVTYVLNEKVDFAHIALGKAPAARDGLLARPEGRYLAFVVTAGATRLVDVGSGEPAEASLARLRELLTARTDQDQALERDLAGDALREQLVDPLGLEDKNLLIVAGGGLGLLPFQLLPLTSTGRLIDKHTISYLAAPRDLLHWARPARRDAGTPLVIADPDYDLGSDHPGTASESLRMALLPGTAEEGLRVASLLGTEAVTGAKAVQISLTAARSPAVLHLATHGFFLPGPEQLPDDDHYKTLYTVTVPGEGTFAVQAERATKPDLTPAGLPRADADPMLRSAVALAGINTWLSGSEPPPEAGLGLLTADEVCTLDLRDTQLVVLSACETGLGDRRKNEGLVGLRWAFAVAGARALVTSLWQVPDQATTELMKEFYAHVTQGVTVPDAIRAAQLSCRSRQPDPYYWSAFVAHGDPAATLSRYRPMPD